MRREFGMKAEGYLNTRRGEGDGTSHLARLIVR